MDAGRAGRADGGDGVSPGSASSAASPGLHASSTSTAREPRPPRPPTASPQVDAAAAVLRARVQRAGLVRRLDSSEWFQDAASPGYAASSDGTVSASMPVTAASSDSDEEFYDAESITSEHSTHSGTSSVSYDSVP